MEPLPTEHVPGKPCFSLLFNEGKLLYSSDSQFSAERLIRLYEERNVRQIWHDCQLQGKGVVHAALDDLLTLPEHIQKITRLMHYGDNMPEFIGRTGHMSFVNQHEIYRL
ncbi:hypothetical protein LJK88_20995 [Paenibacillus sp. P26]|nr:hypothetical protein LJK88_20995 [Paenibacillus sp. P26]